MVGDQPGARCRLARARRPDRPVTREVPKIHLKGSKLDIGGLPGELRQIARDILYLDRTVGGWTGHQHPGATGLVNHHRQGAEGCIVAGPVGVDPADANGRLAAADVEDRVFPPGSHLAFRRDLVCLAWSRRVGSRGGRLAAGRGGGLQKEKQAGYQRIVPE